MHDSNFSPNTFEPTSLKNKININMNLILKFKACVFYFFIFYQKKAFQKLWKMVFISCKKLFSFLRYFVIFFTFLFFFQLPNSKGQNIKRIFLNMFLQLKERLATSSRPFLFFITLSIRRDLVQRKKLTFSWSLLKYLFFKSMLHVIYQN